MRYEVIGHSKVGAYAHVVEGFVLDGQQARLTQAALETPAGVAYRQPVSRARVSGCAGVAANCAQLLETE